jgi:hypothetical protein
MLRLDQAWSFRQLGDKMAAAGIRIPWRTLNYLLTHEDVQDRARETTIHQIVKYLRHAHNEGLIDEVPTDAAPELRSHDVVRRRKRSKRAVLRPQSVSRR